MLANYPLPTEREKNNIIKESKKPNSDKILMRNTHACVKLSGTALKTNARAITTAGIMPFLQTNAQISAPYKPCRHLVDAMPDHGRRQLNNKYAPEASRLTVSAKLSPHSSHVSSFPKLCVSSYISYCCIPTG